MPILDETFVSSLIAKDNEISSCAHIKNPWFTQRYDREREKLFILAMKLNKEFVLSSKHCRDNFKTLSQYWGYLPSEDKERIWFHDEDKKQMLPALYQTLFLLVKVISSTFAYVGTTGTERL